MEMKSLKQRCFLAKMQEPDKDDYSFPAIGKQAKITATCEDFTALEKRI
jgi:hypothetical protein